MNHSMQPAIQHLFQVSSLEAVSREQLEKFVEEYPCFGYGHYLLSRKLRTENADQFLVKTQKTSLYFSNPFWLQWMLENAPEPDGKYSPAADFSAREHSPAPDVAAREHSPAPEPIAQDLIPEPAPIHPEEPILDEEPPFVLEETEQTVSAPTETPFMLDETDPPFVLDVTESPSLPAETWPEMESPEAPAATTALEPDTEDPTTAAELLFDSLEKAKALRESLQKINEDYQSQNGHPAATEVARPVEEPIHDEEPPFVPREPDQPVPAPEPRHIEPVITETTAEPSSPTIITETPLLFEPLHTIDYFASQGIRLTLEENPTDPLGRQLKSFTEWLRTMRRLPQKDREIIPNRVAEQAVQNFAAHSIEGKEPVTETMAEVLAKQGMPERARIVYEKLSLLNPNKSAYFAAKIEQLNIH
jgi:hypothetical protein